MTAREDSNRLNVAGYLKRMARVQPFKRAVVYPHARDRSGRVAYTHVTFQQLDLESDRLAFGLEKAGITRGTRTILMVRPSLEFFELVFAIFKIGAVPVVVDPGMGIRRMLECFRETGPSAFIGIPMAHVLRVLYRGFFNTVRVWVTVGRRWFWGGQTLSNLRPETSAHYPVAATTTDETAAILFTTGSTGPAKGVVYTHGIFDAQIRRIKHQYGIATDEIDLPTFPLFALFDPALGMTAIIPDMDPTRPARVNPDKIIEAVNNHGVTNMFASPALLNRVGHYGSQNGIKLTSLKRVISAGAPVMPANLAQFSNLLLADAQIHTGYGATEAMPVASISSHEILSQTREMSEKGFGICVGEPVKGIDVRIIRISDDAITDWSEDVSIPNGSIGEIAVKGDLVTRSYYERPQADALAKIRDGDASWHRMGDLGRLDEKGRIWFYGRKSQRVVTAGGTLFTIPCEAIFNNHPRVYRSALVGVGPEPGQKPVICIERQPGDSEDDKDALTRELLALAKSNAWTQPIETILYHEGFPVDIRHNSKIFREKLAVWAEKKLKARS
jgi:acyl-CoA synthetase (AMP-forming)/AMP-acid ligase II